MALLRHSELILLTLENHYNCSVLFCCDSWQEEGRKSTRWPAIGRNTDCDWSNFCFLFHCWNFLYRILPLIVNIIIELGKKFGFFCYILWKNQNKFIGQPSSLKRYYCSMWGKKMRIWFLTSNFQKLSETETAMEKFHHKKKKILWGVLGKTIKMAYGRLIFGYFSPIKSWVRYYWRLFYFYQIKIILSFNDKWYLPENYFNDTYLRLDEWEIVEYDMKLFPCAVFIYYVPFTYLDFLIQGTATERSLDVGSQDLNSVICFSTYM